MTNVNGSQFHKQKECFMQCKYVNMTDDITYFECVYQWFPFVELQSVDEDSMAETAVQAHTCENGFETIHVMFIRFSHAYSCWIEWSEVSTVAGLKKDVLSF